MKTKFLGLTIIAVFLVSSFAMAQPQGKQVEGQAQNHRKAMMAKKQKMAHNERQDFLNEDQKEKAKELRLVTAKKVKPLKNELNELQARQRTLTTADQADMKAINSNIDKMSTIKAEIQKIKAAQHQEFRAMLSEEQLLKFDVMKEKRGNKDRKPGMRDGRQGGERPQRG